MSMLKTQGVAERKFKEIKPGEKFILFKEEGDGGGMSSVIILYPSESILIKLDTSMFKGEAFKFFRFEFNAVNLSTGKIEQIDDTARVQRICFD